MCYRLATLYKKRLQLRCFPDNFAKFLKAPFFIQHLRWLFLFEHIHLIDLEFLLWIWTIHFVSWASQGIEADKNIFKVKNEDLNDYVNFFINRMLKVQSCKLKNKYMITYK